MLDYDEPLNSGSVPIGGDFVVLVQSIQRAIATVSVSSDSVILELDTPVQQGELVTVSYTAGGNPVEDETGNDAPDLSGQSVTNNTILGIPTPPIELSATAVSGGDIEISFNDVDGVIAITSYAIKRSATQGGPYTQIGTIADNESASYSFTDNTTTNATTYFYVITSTNTNAVESSESEEVFATADDVNPTLQFASVDGATLTLDYDELMDITSIPAALDFAVRVNGGSRTITNVNITGPRVILTIDPAATSGDNVEIDYSIGSNPVQDAAGNDASAFTNQFVTNYAFDAAIYGPDPCPIVNGQDIAWACFDGTFNGTSMTANVGGLDLATVTAAPGSATTFAPNALQQWASGSFSGDQFNGPQVNPVGTGGDATSLDITIPSSVPSDALILSLNRLTPTSGAGTSYTLEAYDGSNNLIAIDDWITGQGTDGGVCTNSVALNYVNGNTRIEFLPTISGNPSCTNSSTPIWFRITDSNVERIELRKIAPGADNIHIGLGVVADFGDAPGTFGTVYSGSGTPPAFHLLNNGSSNTVYLGAGVDGDGNGAVGANSNGDDIESSGIGNGDDEDAISILADINTAQTSYSTTLVCTNGGNIGGWIDFDQSGTFDANEYASGVCSTGSVTLNWLNISGLVTGTSYARFRIATALADVVNPTGAANDGEVEDYVLNIIPPPLPDLEITKTVDIPGPVEGDNVTFTLTVTNPGVFEATGIQVVDQLPTGLTFVSSSASQGTYDFSTGIWNLGTLADGDTTSATLSITALVNSGTLGNTIVNIASVSELNETDPELNNNSASAGVTVVPESTDIGITKIVDDSSPIEGQSLTYTVVVTNNGPKEATGLTIIDQVPTGLTYVSSTPSVGTYNNSTGIWDIDSLATGSQATLVLVLSVDVGSEGNTITNAADINTLNQTDPNSENDTGSVDVTVIPAGFPASCTEVTSLNFTNFSLISGSAGELGAVYEYTSVAPGVNALVEIVTKFNTTIDQFDQSSSGTSQNFQPQITAVDENLADAFFDVEVRFIDSLTSNPRFLTFTASAVDVDGDNNNLREFVGFQRLNSFTVENTTNLAVSNSGIFTTFLPSITTDFPGINLNNTNNIAYTTYTNEPQFRIRIGIDDPVDGASRLYSINFDPCIINNFTNPTSTDIVEVGVTKSVDANNFEVGNTVTYTVTASNNQGNSVADVEVTDQLPAGLTYVQATASQGTYNNSTGIWDIGTLSGLQNVNLVIEATVDAGTEGNTITNTATLTSFTGTDGNVNNNTSSVNIFINDPQSTSCNELPLFSFTNPSLEQGVPLQVNAIYRFNNVASGLDALVKVLAISNATLDDIDEDGIANQAANFSPFFTAFQGGGYVDWEIQFVQAGTSIPVKRDFSLTGLDIDGNDLGSGRTVQDYLGFAQNQSNTVQAGNNLLETTSGPFQVFQSSTLTDGNGSFDINHMAYISYNYTSVFQIRTGSVMSSNYSDDRLVDIDFTQCRNQDFTNPVVTTRNADLAIVKTVDQPNPLENETINFTLTVTNNGPEPATEIDVSEALPTGLTLVQTSASQGSYDQLNEIWRVGSISNGGSATLALETTVNSGLSVDSLINTTYILGLNQFDPTISNDTSSVVIKISVELKGTVFEDITGDGVSEDTNFGDASGDQQALENVEVHLFKDGGDGLADGVDDFYEQTVLTDNLGEYVFQVGDDEDYWIVVDSKTGELSDGNFWAEQTFAPIGALCTDEFGSTIVTTTPDNCFGGRRGNQSDNISATPTASDLLNAEHIAAASISGSGISGIDFGFSFNVVTNIDDDDEDGSSARSAQGTLRQFITNANTIPGANTMRFVPAVVPNSTSWWSVTLAGTLPEITDPLTTIDGTAYDLSSPKAELNLNTGSVGTGSTVGIDNLLVNTVARPEFEIDLNDAGTGALVINSTGAITIRDLAVFNNSTTIEIKGTSNGLIENTLIGAQADGSDPTGVNRSELGVEVSGSSAANVLIQQNYIAYLGSSGIYSENSGADITIFSNEMYQTGLSATDADGIEGIGTWTIEQNRVHEIGNSSSSTVNGGSGIELGATSGSSSGNTVRNNSIYSNATTGILTLNGVTNSIIEKNIIYQNGTNYTSGTKLGAGVRLATPNSVSQDGIRITRNSFYSNYGISIDVVTGGTGEADGVSPNDGVTQSSSAVPNTALDYPVFTLSTLENDILTIEGYVGTSTTKLQETFTIEVYKAEDDGDSDALIEIGGSLTRPHGEGRYLLGIITTNTDGTFSTSIDVSGASTTIAFNDRITAIAISSLNNTSEFSANQRVVPTGVTISGFVYHDVNHNASKDPAEAGIQGVTIVLYNTQENNCKSVLSGADGRYEFTNVLNGDYDLIESFGQSVPTPDICTPAEADPVDYISTTPNLRSITVNNLPAFQDFGDFEGIRIEGTVSNDNGASAGTANDGIQNGGEGGISTQLMKAFTSGDVLIEQASSAADGSYELYVPKSIVGSGGTVIVEETNGAEYLSTGGDAGTTNGTYDNNTDRTEFTINPGTVYTGVNFANVQRSTLITDGSLVVQPGVVGLFTHSFIANTVGDVTFTTTSVNNPDINFPVVVNHDSDCSGTIESGEPILFETSALSVEAGDEVCLVIRVTAPNGTNDGATSTTTITATFDYANSAIQQVLTRTDILSVSSQDGGLVIVKAVDKPQALPGDTLLYTIEYENLGDEPISEVIVTDEVPIFTTFFSAECGTLTTGVTECEIEDPGVGNRGTVRWTFTGVLQPGDSGIVSYKVLIDN
ncbi:MAG: GEVED domain-containing protein [Balneolales bacterium]|nr:GEVED domain-containing protein [Balneolales bacterium]